MRLETDASAPNSLSTQLGPESVGPRCRTTKGWWLTSEKGAERSAKMARKRSWDRTAYAIPLDAFPTSLPPHTWS